VNFLYTGGKILYVNESETLAMNHENPVAKHFLESVILFFEKIKNRAEKAIDQIQNEERLFWLPDGESNSIALLIKHLAGNMRSRWTNFLTSDGEKPNRNRPSEFDQNFTEPRRLLMRRWEFGWGYLFTALNTLKQSDLMRKVFIRKEAQTVLEAILRQMEHYASHIGQIVFLAKHIQWQNWETLSIHRDKEIFDFREYQ
jgi:hypothetical protein